jgi:murein L,D-transpeptidase YcbB/YkuD
MREVLDRLSAGMMWTLIAVVPAAAALAAPDIAPLPPSSSPSAIAASTVTSPAPAIDIDAGISDALHSLVGGQMERLMPRNAERAAATSYYKAHNFAPIWIKNGALTPRASMVISRLKNAAADGLDPADYPTPDFGGDATSLARDDIRLTRSVLDYARHLETGRIAPARVFSDIDYGVPAPDPAILLQDIMSSIDVNATFESFNPPAAGFHALKDKLAALRTAADAETMRDDRIPNGPTLHPGMRDPRVLALRTRLGLHVRSPNDTVYDMRVARAVAALQRHARLRPDGALDARTLAVINGPAVIPASKQIDIVTANMERWRWLPHDLGRNYVIVNIPDYSLRVVRDGREVWRTKIVAGRPQTPTPLLTASMDTVIVNPSWHVPQSIIQNEYLPRYASDPRIFERLGLEVKRSSDGHISVVQPPGAANALGRIKFNFPNRFQVYLHDTPDKRLFASDKRAFSHGCMRVEDPTKLGEIILSMAMPAPTPGAHDIVKLFGHEERTFTLTNRPMVHLTYQTAFVDESGKLQLRDDLYGFDARIHDILGSDERKVADLAPPRDPRRDLGSDKSNQEILGRVERREAQNPLQFFGHTLR